MDPHERYREKLLKSCSTFFGRWRGARALMWELTVSHKTLRIVLTRDGSPGNLVIACLEPEHIHGPLRWSNAELSLVPTTLADGGDGYVLQDGTAGLEIVCGAIEVSENVKLW